MRVAAEIGQYGLGSAEGRLGINDPFGPAQRREMGCKGIRIGQPRQIAEELQLARLVQPGQPFEEQTPEQS